MWSIPQRDALLQPQPRRPRHLAKAWKSLCFCSGPNFPKYVKLAMLAAKGQNLPPDCDDLAAGLEPRRIQARRNTMDS